MVRSKWTAVWERRGLCVILALAASVLPATAFSGTLTARSYASVHDPVYRIPVRVHLGGSGRGPAAFQAILEEINDIWLSQAGICFEMSIDDTEQPAEHGMDLWFRPRLSEADELNGVFRSDHDIEVRDTPNLGPAEHPARHPAARTAAHELGHGLGLAHRQDSDDNLMRSKTYGWQLNEEEVQLAREAARVKARPDMTVERCVPVQP